MPAQKSKEAAKKDALDAERQLFDRAGYPHPAEEETVPTEAERDLAASKYKDMMPRAQLEKNTAWTKQIAGSTMHHTRQLNALRTVQAAHSKTLRDVMDALSAIQRQLRKWEKQGIVPGEDSLNPDINPLLGKLILETRR